MHLIYAKLRPKSEVLTFASLAKLEKIEEVHAGNYLGWCYVALPVVAAFSAAQKDTAPSCGMPQQGKGGDFHMAGSLMALSLVQGGPAPSFLSDAIVQCLCGNEYLQASIDQVPDLEVQEKLKMVHFLILCCMYV